MKSDIETNGGSQDASVFASKDLLGCVNEPKPPVFDNRKLFDKAKVEKSEKSIEWGTPPEVYDPLNAEFGFTIDVCATAENSKCARYYTQADDALKQKWEGVCWMNPPFGRCVKDWILKAMREAEIGRATTVCLIPAKTNTNW